MPVATIGIIKEDHTWCEYKIKTKGETFKEAANFALDEADRNLSPTCDGQFPDTVIKLVCMWINWDVDDLEKDDQSWRDIKRNDQVEAIDKSCQTPFKAYI